MHWKISNAKGYEDWVHRVHPSFPRELIPEFPNLRFNPQEIPERSIIEMMTGEKELINKNASIYLSDNCRRNCEKCEGRTCRQCEVKHYKTMIEPSKGLKLDTFKNKSVRWQSVR